MEEGYTPAVWRKEEGGIMEAFEEDEEEDDLLDIKKKLFDGLETPMKRESFLGTKKQPVVVYLRVRPKSQLEILNQDAECLHQMSENELLAVAPPTSQTFKNKNGARSVAEGNQKFLFTKIFNPEANQKEVFEEALMPTLKDFFEGQNCLVFTYGVTNSGKTYTVTGTSTEPGILPRSLDVIFNSIDQKQFSSITIKPKHFSSVEYLDNQEQERQEALKEEIIGKARELGSQLSPTALPVDETDMMSDSDTSTMSKASSNYSKVTEEGLSFEVHDDSSVELEGGEHHKFSVWVSFAEIYNEFIYDLLTEAPAKGKQRPALKLAEDKNRNHFIKGLRELEVDNVEEAMLLLRLGLQHRHVAATRLNYQSSRSHSIYTIKLIKVVDMEHPQHAIVNRISIVDLAGAERSGKTGATGIRVREAGNINNSLLTLGKCIDAMKYNQNRKGGEERVVPFRESKLTRLFQNYFVGKGKGVRQGKITMFVNVSNSTSVFDENIHVLKFSALASKVVPQVMVLPGRNPARTPLHPSLLPSESVLPQLTEETEGRRSVAWETEEEEEAAEGEGEGGTLKVTRVVPVFTAPCGHCKSLQEQLAQCQEEARAKISELQVKLIEQEYLIRQEVCREFGEQLIEIEERHSQELEEQAADLGEMYEKKYQLLHKSMKKQQSRKRRRPDDDVDDRSAEQSLRAEVSSLKERVEELEEELAMEENRAAAELCDTAESHETRTVLLNQQLADMALKLSAAQSECQSLREQLDSAVKHVAELSSEREEWEESSRKSALAQCEENEQLRAEAEALRKTIASLTSQTEALERDKMESLTHHEGEVQMLETQRADAVTEAELLQQRISELTAEKREVEERVEKVMREKREVEERVQEVVREKREAGIASEEDMDKDATLSHLCSEVTQLSSQLEACQSELSLLKCTHAQEMTGLQEKHKEEVCRVREAHAGEVEALREERNVVGAKLAVKQEAIYKLETEIEAKSKEVSVLSQRMEGKEKDLVSLQSKVSALEDENNTLNNELKEKVKRMLRDYETMLKNQSSRLSELDAEREELHVHNTELEARIRDLEMKLGKVTSARDRLDERVEELTATLQESRKALSQREAELLGSSEQCRVVLEEQIADLKKQLSTAEQDLCVTKEDVRSLHQQLREKDSELLSLAKSSSGDQACVQSLSTELEETKQRAEQSSQEHVAQLEALKGHHQLEMAQLTIRVRELTEQLEGQMASTSATHDQEVESLQTQWRTEVASLSKDLKQAEKKLVKMKAVEAENKNLKKDINKMKEDFECTRALLDAQILSLESDLREREEELKATKQKEIQTAQDEWLKEAIHHQDMKVTAEEDEEHIYEEPPELPEDTTVYETITDASTSTCNPQHSSSVLQAIENTADRSVHQSTMISDLDRSKPYIPVLDSSSQLMEDSFVVGEKRTEIHVTPLAKKKRVGRTRKRKRDTEMEKFDTKNSPAKKKYPLRNRLKIATDHEDVENTPLMKAPSLKKLTRILSSGTRTPVTPSEGHSSPINLTPPRTRRKKPIRKSQISGPLELLESPHQQTRQPLEVKTKFSLGRQLRPLRTIK